MQSPDPGLVVAEREIERVQRARFLGAELWSEAGPPDAEELRRLVVDGLEKGFLTYDEIAAALEDVGLTREQREVWGAKTRSTSRKITDLQPVTEL